MGLVQYGDNRSNTLCNWFRNRNGPTQNGWDWKMKCNDFCDWNRGKRRNSTDALPGIVLSQHRRALRTRWSTTVQPTTLTHCSRLQGLGDSLWSSASTSSSGRVRNDALQSALHAPDQPIKLVTPLTFNVVLQRRGLGPLWRAPLPDAK